MSRVTLSHRSTLDWPARALVFLSALGAALACSGSGGGESGIDDPSSGNSGSGSRGGTSTGGLGSGSSAGNPVSLGGSGATDSGGEGGSGSIDGKACASVEQEAKSTFRPIDVVFVIDNSSSMQGEIEQVQARINDDFARIIETSGLDYRVIMLSRYGQVGVKIGESDHPICIGAPLGAGDCSDPAGTPLENSERFFHFSADIESHDSWCALLDGWDKSDEWGDPSRSGWQPLAPGGWSGYLRPEAFKVFVEISDDNASCNVGGNDFDDHDSVSGGETAAANFDAALLALSPNQFGTADARNYVWHSIVGLAPNAPALEAWAPSAPIQLGQCTPGAEAPGTGYQALSRLTGGLRYPSCSNENFDAIFNAIAEGIVQGAELNCEWEIPSPPAGESFDKDRVNLRYTPGDGSAAESILFVPEASGCGDAEGWQYDDVSAPSRVIACPVTCERLKNDVSGRIDVLFGCQTQVQDIR